LILTDLHTEKSQREVWQTTLKNAIMGAIGNYSRTGGAKEPGMAAKEIPANPQNRNFILKFSLII